MTLVMRCEDKERLVEYLYGESSDAERAAVEAHLARCAPCSAELQELQGVRADLAGWQPPEVDLAFRLTRDPVVPVSVPRRWRAPWWASAAAAVILVAVAAEIANLDVKYGGGQVTIRTGWVAQAPPAPVPTGVMAVRPTAASVTPRDLDALEERLRAEFARNVRVEAPVPVPSTGDRDLLQRVRALVDESEQRQQKELALRLAQVLRDVESQRRADLVRIEQNLGQIEGLAGQEAVRQREMLNYLMRVSQRR